MKAFGILRGGDGKLVTLKRDAISPIASPDYYTGKAIGDDRILRGNRFTRLPCPYLKSPHLCHQNGRFPTSLLSPD